VGVTLVARLPGDIKKSTGTEADGGVIWTAPNDGTAVAVVIGTAESKVDGGFWQILATIFGYILGLWLIVIGLLILLVIFARRRRTARSTTRASIRATPDA
jgi:heme/copper-type cytochrome/quinol oxidase subunit 2